MSTPSTTQRAVQFGMCPAASSASAVGAVALPVLVMDSVVGALAIPEGDKTTSEVGALAMAGGIGVARMTDAEGTANTSSVPVGRPVSAVSVVTLLVLPVPRYPPLFSPITKIWSVVFRNRTKF